MAHSERFVELIEEVKDLHLRKNSGYAGKDSTDPWANFRMAEKVGITPFKGCLVRMTDKFMRVCNLAMNPANDQVNESIKDTLMDLAAYSLIAACLYEENIPKQEKTDVRYEETQQQKEEYDMADDHCQVIYAGTDLGNAKILLFTDEKVLVKFEKTGRISEFDRENTVLLPYGKVYSKKIGVQNGPARSNKDVI